jgi:hypothetical protein
MSEDTAKPDPVAIAYEVAVSVDPSSTATVSADVFIEISTPTHQLVFDASGLSVKTVSVHGPDYSQKAKLEMLSGNLVLSFTRTLDPGTYRVFMELTTSLQCDAAGSIFLAPGQLLFPLLQPPGLTTMQLRTTTLYDLDVAVGTQPITTTRSKIHKVTTFAPTPPMNPRELTLRVTPLPTSSHLTPGMHAQTTH